MTAITSAIVRASEAVRVQEGLLINDSITVALIRRLGLTAVATYDADFERVGSLRVYQTGRYSLKVIRQLALRRSFLRWLRMVHISTYSYDREADVSYLSVAPAQKPTAAVELHENIFLRFNLTGKRAVGLPLMDFSVLPQTTPLGPRSFPLTS